MLNSYHDLQIKLAVLDAESAMLSKIVKNWKPEDLEKLITEEGNRVTQELKKLKTEFTLFTQKKQSSC